MRKNFYSKYISKVYETSKGSANWFGYYNYDTLNFDQTKMLCNKSINDACVIKKGMTIDVGYFDIPTGKWHYIGQSDSFNWQQGAMLQWLPGKGNENKVIFNTSDGHHNIAKIVDIETLKEKTIDWSIYGLTPDGKKSIALNMERSHWCRAYHYESIVNKLYDVRVAEDDGIFEVDLENNSVRRIISIQDIIHYDYEEYFEKAKHWVEHIMVSPSGKRFCFLHRFTVSALGNYETRLFVANIDGTGLQIIPGWRKYYWSHFGWNGDDAFAIYTYETSVHDSIINKLNNNNAEIVANRGKTLRSSLIGCLKTVYHKLPISIRNMIHKNEQASHTYYQYYKSIDDSFILSDIFSDKLLDIDGHPSFTKDGKYMITDSYPDYKHYRRLILYNIERKKSILLGKFYAGLYNKPGICDLHPKLCKNDQYLAIDTAYDGSHHMMLFKIDWEQIRSGN